METRVNYTGMCTDNRWFTYSEWCGYKTNLKDINLIKENGKYYFDVMYDVETESEKFILHIPRIKLDIITDRVQLCTDVRNGDPKLSVNLGFGSTLTAECDHNGQFLTETVIETKTHEMTVSEIEKKLGYKIKIVSE